MTQRDIPVQNGETAATAALRVVTTLAGGVVRYTTNGVHSDGSLHYAENGARAVDVALPSGPSYNSPELGEVAKRLLELIPIQFISEFIWAGPNPIFIKNGKRTGPYAAASHRDHIHLAVTANFRYNGSQKVADVSDNPDLPNIRGPVSFHPVVDSSGMCHGYYIFSASTGELHAFGDPLKVCFYGRSEVIS